MKHETWKQKAKLEKNLSEIEIRSLSSLKHYYIFSSKNSGPPTFYSLDLGKTI